MGGITKKVVTIFLVFCILVGNFVSVKAEVLNDKVANKNFDINNDFIIDIKDLAQVATSYNVNKKMSKWIDKYDFNNDGIIDIYDLTRMSKFFGNEISINNITMNTEQGKSFSLPETTSIMLGNNCDIELPISWNSTTVNTSKVGKYTYTGIVSDYNKPIKLTLNVVQPNSANVNNFSFATYDGTWVYYSNSVNAGKLSKAKIDGTGVTKINDDQALFITIQDSYIYYCNVSDNSSVYRINKNGTERTKLASDSASYMRIYDNFIYYQNQNDNYSLYKMNLDGSNKVKIIEDTPMYVNLYEQDMYYSNFSNNGEIDKINLNSLVKTTLNTNSALYISIQDSYLFYQNYENKYIYRMNLDGSNIKLMKSVNGVELNAVDGWVYYINQDDQNCLYRISYDGSTDQKLNDLSISEFNISGGRLFLYDKYGYLYSSNLDGTDLKYFGICLNILSIDNLNIQIGQGDYCELPDAIPAQMTDGSKILVPVVWNSYKIDTNSKQTYKYTGRVQGFNKDINLSVEIVENGNSNGNINHGGQVVCKDGWEYFCDEVDNKLYKIKTNETNKIKLSDDTASYINVIGEWVYYISDFLLYKVKTDGSSRTLVCSDKMYSVNIVGDWAFYSNNNDKGYLYKIKTDGTNKIKLCEDTSSNINIMGNWIYYLNEMDGRKLCKVTKDGYERTQIYDYTVDDRYIASGDKIYIKNGSTILYMNQDGTNQEKIESDSYILDFNILGDKIYYCDRINDNLSVMNINGTEKHILSDNKLATADNVISCSSNIQISDNWIYYRNVTCQSKMFKIRTDGTNNQRFGIDMTITNSGPFNVNIQLGETYKLPATVTASVSNGELINVPITWNSNDIDVSKLGTTTYEGTISGYNNKVYLTVTVVNKIATNRTSNQNFVAQSGDWIIINNFKMKSDGTQKGNYTSDYIYTFGLIDDWVYYPCAGGFKKVKIDGTGSTILFTDDAGFITILGDWIYYINVNDDCKIYKVRFCGLDKTEVTNDPVTNLDGRLFVAPDGWIYYSNKNDDYKLYKIKTDGTGRMKICDDPACSINVDGDWIYYISGYYTISKIKTDGSNKSFVSNITQYTTIKILDGWIYLDNNYSLSKMKTDGSNSTKICNLQPIKINILNDWIYFSTTDCKLYRIKIDGSDKQLISE